MIRTSVILATCVVCTTNALAAEYAVYYLGGQSNMDGYGQVDELPRQLQGPVEGVYIFHGNTSPDQQSVDGRGKWAVLRPGHGVGFRSDGQRNHYKDRFGVEISFARRLRELHPGRKIALIKYSRGGTSIDQAAAGNFGCWDPDFNRGRGAGQGINQYDHFLATVRNAMSDRDIDDDGQPDTLVPMGILWMQGESDASYTAEIAARYEQNLKRLIDLIRAAFRVDDLPVAIGRISDSGQDEKDGKVWGFGKTVRDAQASFVQQDVAAALVTSTDSYGYSDRWHYDSEGYIDLGKEFAEALVRASE